MSQPGDTNRLSCNMVERCPTVENMLRQEVVRLFKLGKTIDALVMLKEKGMDITATREDGLSMLHSVSVYGSKEAVEFLWERGARPSIVKMDGSTVLHSAVRCQENNLRDEHRAKVVDLFMSSSKSVPNLLDINHRTNKGWTALKLAVKNELERCVETLLEHGADPDIPDLEGYYPLHNAVGNQVIMKLLLTKVKNVDCQTAEGETALFLSARKGLLESCLMFLEYNANPNIANKENITPLFLAARAGQLELVKALVSKGACVNTTGAQQNVGPLHWAAHKEMEAIALFLIEHGADVMLVDKEGRTPLSMASPELASKMLAAAKKANPCISLDTCGVVMSAEEKAIGAACCGNVPALQSLVNAGVSVNYVNGANKASLLHMAAYCGQLRAVFYLMNEGADWRAVDADGDTVLHFACIKEVHCGRHDQTLEYLLSTPARALKDSCNKRGDTPIIVAARSHLVSRVKILLRHGVDARIPNSKKELPIHKACTSDRSIEALLFLAECYPDLNVHDGDGWTPLMYATKCNATSVVKYLLQRGASANVCHPQGYSPLYLSVQEGNMGTCEMLLQAKADPQVVCGSHDYTPLHLAASKDLRTVCLLLMQHGASINAQDNRRNTPIDLAASAELRQAMEAFANGRDANIGSTSEQPLHQLSVQQETSNLLQSSCPNTTPNICHQSNASATSTMCHQSNASATPTVCHQSDASATPTVCHQSNASATPTVCTQGTIPICSQSRESGMTICNQTKEKTAAPRSKRSPSPICNQGGIPVCKQMENSTFSICSQKGSRILPVCNQAGSDELRQRDNGEEVREQKIKEKLCLLQEELQMRDKEICKLRREICALHQEREELICHQEVKEASTQEKVTEVVPWWKVDRDRFEYNEAQLNKDSHPAGRFYNVHRGQFRSMDVAVKCVLNISSWSRDVYTVFASDVEAISHLHCTKIVQFLGACIDPCRQVATLIVEYMSRGSLHSILYVEPAHLEWRTKLKILQDICGGMAYLHSLPMLHRMLTPHNILIGEHFNAKISDIGFFETKAESNFYTTLQAFKAKHPVPQIYTAPEILEASQFSTASDVYSFGILLCEIATGEKPYAESLCPTILAIKVIMGHRPTLACNVPSAYQKLTERCWNGDLGMRPTFRDALEELNKLYAETNPVQL